MGPVLSIVNAGKHRKRPAKNTGGEKSPPAQTFPHCVRTVVPSYNRGERMPRPASIVVVLSVLGVAAAGCGWSASRQGDARAQARRLPLRGTIVSADGDRVTVAHDAIAGYMDAMTMTFAVRDTAVVKFAEPGALIAAILVIEGDRSWLDDVSLTSRPTSAAAIRKSLTGAAGAQAGDLVPDFHLVDQDGRAISIRDFRGKALAITFIYVRCPLPDFCPFVSKNFAAAARELSARPDLAARTRLLSVTIDPEHDTPDVLRRYRSTFLSGAAGDSAVWQMATGSVDQIDAVSSFFGLRYWPESGQIVHALRTAVLDTAGRVTHVDAGNAWKPAGLVAELEHATR
jgi:protein SCO1